MKNIPLFRKVILSLVMLMMSLTFISSLNVYADDEKFETTISFDIHKDKSTNSNNNSPKSYDKNDKNHDGVVTCDEINGKGWIWSNKKKTCVYSVSNTDSSLISVPSNIGFSFNSDGTVSETIAYTIKNNSTDKPLYIKAIKLTGLNGWTLVDTKPTSDNSKQVHLTINNIEQVEGKYNFNDYIYLGVGEEVSLTFKIERSSFTTSYKEDAFILCIESYEQGNRVYLNGVEQGSLDTTGTNVKYDETQNKYYIDYPTTKSGGTSVTYGTLPTPTSRTGYTYKWVDQSGNEITKDTVVNPSNTISVSWIANKYSIVFDSNGGTGTMSDQSMTYDTSATLTTNSYTKTDYTFVGWNTKSDGSGTAYEYNASVNNLTSENNGTVTLYAMWKITASSENITITYKDNTGTADAPAKEYDGNPINIDSIKYKNDTTLTLGKDYTVTYTLNGQTVDVSNTNKAGTYTITINFIGDYTGTVTKTYTINPKSVTISGLKVKDKQYDGTDSAEIDKANTSYTINNKISNDDVSVDDSNATVSFNSANIGSNINVTGANFTLKGNDAGNYTLSSQPSATASITKRSVSNGDTNVSITFNDDSTSSTKEYDGNEVTISTLKVDDNTLTKDTDYTLSWADSKTPKDIGEYKGTITFTGDKYTGSYNFTYTITTKAVTIKDLTVKDKAYAPDYLVATIKDVESYDTGVNDESFKLTNIKASFSDYVVGENKEVTISSATVTGKENTNTNNYSISYGTTTGNIKDWRDIWSGESLGSEITSDQLTEIASGYLKTIGLGDYWTMTYDSKEIKFRVADYKYYYEYYQNNTGTYDLCIVPDEALGDTMIMQSSGPTNSKGYYQCDGYNTLHGEKKNKLPDSIKNNLYTHDITVSIDTNSSSPYSNTWKTNSSDGIELMSAMQLYGSEENLKLAACGYVNNCAYTSKGYTSPEKDKRLAMFKYNIDGTVIEDNTSKVRTNTNIVRSYNWHLNNTESSTNYVAVIANASANSNSIKGWKSVDHASVRPLIVIKGSN